MYARTLFDKLWDAHVVAPETETAPAVLYIDLHLIHEVTSPQAFAELAARGLPVARPERTKGTLDHSTPTLPADAEGKLPYANAEAEAQVAKLRENAAKFGVELFDFGSAHRGIVHVIGPELGITQPGMTIVCGDSHTATHGAFGALAFGIGTSEVGHVLATQCLLQRRPKTLAITVDGELGMGVTAKDLILHVIGVIGVNGGTGHVIEYRGSAIRALSMDERMTVCNMSIEAGARAGLIAPDETTFEFLRGTPRAPQGEDFERFLLPSPASVPEVLPLIRKIWTRHRQLRASMLQDLEKGRDTEINFINGVICQQGREAGVATPFNDKVVELVSEAQKRKGVNDFSYLGRFDGLLEKYAKGVLAF